MWRNDDKFGYKVETLPYNPADTEWLCFMRVGGKKKTQPHLLSACTFAGKFT